MYSGQHTATYIMNHCHCTQGYIFWSRYRGDGIDGVYDREQQHVVDAAGVVWVSWPGDFLASGVIDEGRVACDVNLVLCCIRNSIAGAIHVLILHQGLALLGHHNHITVNKYFKRQIRGPINWITEPYFINKNTSHTNVKKLSVKRNYVDLANDDQN